MLSRSVARRGAAWMVAITVACGEMTEGGQAPDEAGAFASEDGWRANPFLFDADPTSTEPIPDETTSYLCRGFSVDTSVPAHMVAFEPSIDGAEIQPHHIVLYRLSAPPPAEAWPCLDMPPGAVAYYGWAPGTQAVQLPREAGFLVGEEGPQTHFALQVHYENPGRVQGLRDQSGVVAWSTEQLRESDAGVLTLGTVQALAIPPGQAAFEHTSECRTDTLAAPIDVFGTFLHGHGLLRQIWTDQFRDAEPIATLGRDDQFRADLQRYRPVSGRIEPNDRLITHCVYDSRQRSEVTMGGDSARAEMCLNSLFYYPRLGAVWCG